MDIYTPIFSKIVDSSLWSEPDYVVKVFLTLLAKKDKDFVVRGTAFNIGRWAQKPEKEVLDALKILSSPDKRRIEKQPFDGRRIEKVDDGWLILNGRFYQDLMREANRRKYKAVKQSEYRLKKSKKPTVGRGNAKALEKTAVAAHGAGDTEAYDEAVTKSLPPGLQ
jgi:hypothetical protein